ncbi:hypothetical protein FHE66_06665 [Georgenia sp. 311]|uniref:hypothetical protein n=1 Tax=Georgenia sp. 311 TaxID=2585134 RepID=UPI001111F7CC|nr:hypothetical protein [Georgenia sp. 311]TNC18466.1 hypothetical protein FHE66_06665 [Georgenia sp. 311]
MEQESAADPLTMNQPDGSVFVFLDESYEPFVAAGAVIVEAVDFARINPGIAELFDRAQGWYHLEGLPSFEEFLRHGFHATSDPLEVRTAFVAFLAEAFCFKSMIVYSDRSWCPDLSDRERLMVVIEQITRDVLRAYRGRPKVIFLFESAGRLDRYVERVVTSVAKKLDRRAPRVEIYFGTKRQPDLLAVPDYVVHIFNKWMQSQRSDVPLLQPTEHQSRAFKAILGSISMARSLDDGRVIRRSLGELSVV